MHQNSRTEIWFKVEQEGDSYLFKVWYEIFRPFQSKWNGINNNDKNHPLY